MTDSAANKRGSDPNDAISGEAPKNWHKINGYMALRDAFFSYLGVFVIILLPTLLLGRTQAGAIYARVSVYFPIPMFMLCFVYMAVRTANRTAVKCGTPENPVRLPLILHFINSITAFIYGVILTGLIGLIITVFAAMFSLPTSKSVFVYVIIYLPLTLLFIVASGRVVSKRTEKHILREATQ